MTDGVLMIFVEAYTIPVSTLDGDSDNPGTENHNEQTIALK